MRADLATDGLRGLSFRCLEGCGFCCTFTPEVATVEAARLRRRFPELRLVKDAGGGRRLPFQGGCGACVLLQRRRCTAYEERPAHCRYFPFHVYFGRRAEAYVNRSCRGVEPAAEGDLGPAFEEQVLRVAPAGAIDAGARRAARVHAEFEAIAREAGAWGDVDAALAAALRDPAPGPLEAALQPFGAADVVARPFYLDPDLRWLTFEPEGGRLAVLEMQEDGSLSPFGRVDPAAWPRDAASAAARHAERLRLGRRDVLAGQAFDIVDAAGYATRVAQAAAGRAAAIEADLRTAQAILAGLGRPSGADELACFYDSRFLDHSTIGGWL